MKFFKLLLLTLFLFSGTVQTKAQPTSEKTVATQAEKQSNSYALLIRNYNHLQAAIKTVNMLTEEGRTIDDFEVVLCGKKIAEINDNQDLLKKAQQKDITVTACGMSMNKFSVKKSDLPDGVRVVKNGLIRIFDLQEQGYKTITL